MQGIIWSIELTKFQSLTYLSLFLNFRLYIDYGEDQEVSSNLLNLFRQHPYLIPTGEPYLEIVRYVVNQLTNMKSNNKTQDAIVVRASLLSNFMLSLWELMPDPENSLLVFLEQFYTDIPKPGKKSFVIQLCLHMHISFNLGHNPLNLICFRAKVNDMAV